MARQIAGPLLRLGLGIVFGRERLMFVTSISNDSFNQNNVYTGNNEL
jgi:hypothetical protein